MKSYLPTFCIGLALLLPAAVRADDEHHEHEKDQRYYDADARDYHQWNQQEERAYREYLRERHEEYRAWNRLNREEQREYWRWRHNHPDHDRDDRERR